MYEKLAICPFSVLFQRLPEFSELCYNQPIVDRETAHKF